VEKERKRIEAGDTREKEGIRRQLVRLDPPVLPEDLLHSPLPSYPPTYKNVVMWNKFEKDEELYR